MMPKQIQNLKKRPSGISWSSSGEKLTPREICTGDKIRLFHENEEALTMSADIIQEDNTVIGKIISSSGEIPGASVGDEIVVPEDFIFVVEKK